MENMDNSLTAQELFEASVLAMMRQGRRGQDGHGNCVYRADDESRCAIGHLMTDEEIDALGNHAEKGLVGLQRAGLVPDRFRMAFHMLCRLQAEHDGANDLAFRADFWRRAQGVAADYGLKMPDWR